MAVFTQNSVSQSGNRLRRIVGADGSRRYRLKIFFFIIIGNDRNQTGNRFGNFGCAERDHYVPAEMIDALKKQFAGSKNVELEVYADADHGFAFPLRAVYNKAAAEQHWERLLSLYKRKLGK